MNISAPFINRPVGTTLLTVAVALAGAVAYLQLPVAPLPQVDFPTIQVQAMLPGASPEIMASSVAAPLDAVSPSRVRLVPAVRLTPTVPVGVPAVAVIGTPRSDLPSVS